MVSQAKVISLAESNPDVAMTANIPSSLYKGKLEPLIKKARSDAKAVFALGSTYAE